MKINSSPYFGFFFDNFIIKTLIFKVDCKETLNKKSFDIIFQQNNNT